MTVTTMNVATPVNTWIIMSCENPVAGIANQKDAKYVKGKFPNMLQIMMTNVLPGN